MNKTYEKIFAFIILKYASKERKIAIIAIRFWWKWYTIIRV